MYQFDDTFTARNSTSRHLIPQIIPFKGNQQFTLYSNVLILHVKHQQHWCLCEPHHKKADFCHIRKQVAQRATIAHLRANFTFSYCKSTGDDDPPGAWLI